MMQTTTTSTTDVYPTSPSPLIFSSLVSTIFLFAVIIGLFIYVVKRNIHTQKGSDFSTLKPSLVKLITSLFIVAIFAPADILLYPGGGPFDSSIQLLGMSWQFSLLPNNYLMFDIIFFLVGFLLMFFRIVFVYYIYKYYLGNTTKKRVTIFGILGELQLPLISLAIIPFGLTNPYILLLIAVPIPILLIVGLAVLRMIPPYQVDSDWGELDESKEWWDKEASNTGN